MKPRIPKTKVCTKCGKRKKLECFASRGGARGRRPSPECRMCKRAYDLVYRAQNGDAIREVGRERRRAAAALYRARDRARHTSPKRQAWVRKYRERALALAKARRLANPGPCRLRSARYYARKRNDPAFKENARSRARAWYQENSEYANWRSRQREMIYGRHC